VAGDTRLEGGLLEEAHYLLERVCEILSAEGVPYWLEGGTLLGIVREQRILPWDNDLDVSVLAEHEPQLRRALRKIRWSGFRVSRRVFEETSPPFPAGGSRMFKIRRRRWFGLRRGKVVLDIFVKYTQGEQSFWLIGPKRRVRKSVPTHFYRDLGTIEFRGRTFPTPSDVEGYLASRYGDWRTPRQDWDSFTDEPTIVKTPDRP
jgi:hypothetical protein